MLKAERTFYVWVQNRHSPLKKYAPTSLLKIFYFAREKNEANEQLDGVSFGCLADNSHLHWVELARFDFAESTMFSMNPLQANRIVYDK